MAQMKKTFDFLELENGGMVYNAKRWTPEEAIKDYEWYEDRRAKDYEPVEVYYRYLTKEEALSSGDSEIEIDYKTGERSWFVPCEKEDNRAIKCWQLGD